MHNPIIEHKQFECGCIMSIAYKLPYSPRPVFKPCNPCTDRMFSTEEHFKQSENLRKKMVLQPKTFTPLEIVPEKQEKKIDEDDSNFELIQSTVEKIDAQERGPATMIVENSEGSFTFSIESQTVLEDEITVTINHHIFK